MQYHFKTLRRMFYNITTKFFRMLVRFGADYRINPHAPPFKQTPANLFNFNLCSRTHQARHLSVNVNTEFLKDSTYDAHWFTVWTTRVSNPIRYSYLNGWTSDTSRMLPRLLRVPNNIIVFYLYVISTASFPMSQVLRFYKCVAQKSDLHCNFLNRLAILYAQ